MLHSLEYYLAAQGLEVRGVDAFEPVENLHRCYLRRDPVFLRSLLRLVGRRVDKRFYFGHLLPGAQRGRAGAGPPARTSCCATASQVGLLRTAAATGTEQRAASAATVQCDRAAPGRAGLPAALPCPARQCIYADPPYIFPGRSMNYYGTRGGHDLVFHTELRDALFASGLPFVVSVNDVPEARKLYSGADSITSLCLGKNSSKPSCS